MLTAICGPDATPAACAQEPPNPVVGILCFAEGASSDGDSLSTMNPSSHGCGVIISPHGDIVTTRHFLGDPETTRYLVVLQNVNPSGHQLVPARAMAADTWSDLAVLKIDRQDLLPRLPVDSPPQIGNAMTIHAGPLSRKTGPAPATGQLPGSSGIIADKGVRFQYGGLLTVDASSPQLTSGCAVLDANGRLAGLTTMLISGQDSTATLAIPVDATFRVVVDSLRQGRLPDYGWTGLTPRDLSANQKRGGLKAVQVTSVSPNSPAEIAGLEFADVITHWNGIPVGSSRQLLSLIGGSTAGAKAELVILRNALGPDPVQELQRGVVLSKRPSGPGRKSWASQPPKRWRGVQVEYPSAIENYRQLAHLVDPAGCVVVTAVQIESPSWNAGLRPRTILTHVNDQRVTSPDSFHSMLNPADSGPVRLTVTDEDTESPRTLTVPGG